MNVKQRIVEQENEKLMFIYLPRIHKHKFRIFEVTPVNIHKSKLLIPVL